MWWRREPSAGLWGNSDRIGPVGLVPAGRKIHGDGQPALGAGLGRLVPVGAQVEEECRRGVAALENWLLSHRQAGREGT